MKRTFRALAVAAAASVATAGFLAASAHADAPAGTFEVDYDASGTSTLKSSGATVDLGPATLKAYISNSGDGSLTGDLALPPASTTFNALGLVPVSATVTFVPSGQFAGQMSSQPPLTISAHVDYSLKLSDVTVGGVPTPVGDSCQTVDPVSIDAATPDGQTFDVTDGGELVGTYTVGQFAHCGLMTPTINLLVPGSGNTVDFELSNGRFVA